MMFSSTAPSRFRLLAGACLAMCGGMAHAAEPTQADLNSIMLYGSTTIAQDSTSSWGVWDQLEPTAAGPDLPKLDIPGLSEWYRALAQVAVTPPSPPSVPTEVTATQICSGGSICGFGRATITSFTGLPVPNAAEPAQFAYSLVATPTTLPEVVREQVAALAVTETPAFTLPVAVTVQSQVLGEGGPLLKAQSGVLTFQGNGYSAGFDNGKYALVAATIGNGVYFDNGQVLAAWFDNPISQYVAGNNALPFSMQFQNSVGVAGVITSDADMASLRASNATATYTGYDLNGLQAKVKPNVTLSVNFGNGSFTGSVNGGADRGTVQTQNTTRGTQLAGLVGVNIDKGVITGANFMSTALSATDGKIGAGSVVQGAFFGPNAAAAGGVVNITKTSDGGAYTNAIHVTPFLTVRDTLLNSNK
jgi:C-lobe and N-lobe beta barrels of Tf-binding protein B